MEIKKPTVADIKKIISVVIDPEMNVNIVDLGLIYGINIDKNNNVYILITFTSPTCPFADQIISQIQSLLDNLDFVNQVEIDITFEPAWNQSMINEDILLEMGLL